GLSWALPALATLGAMLSVAYSIRFIHDVFFNGEPKDLPKTPHDPPRMMLLPVFILVLLCIAIGLLPMTLVQGVLMQAVAAVTLRLPELDIALWHGFNMPLLM